MWVPSDASLLSHFERLAFLLLRPLYSGAEAVILFFVLSGLVLSLPYLRGHVQTYPIYLLRRILRIYGPYLGALALALVGASIWHGHSYHGEWATKLWSMPLSPRLISEHIAFLGVYDWTQYDFVIWSLIQELRISIIFPILLALVLRIGSISSVALGTVLSCVAIELLPANPDFLSMRYSFGITVHYTAFFIIGILLASKLGEIANWWKLTSSVARGVMGAASLIAYAYGPPIAQFISSKLLHHHTTVSTNIVVGNWVTMIGAVGLILVALNAPQVRRILNGRVPQFAGKISYSLYLTHPTVLCALTFFCRNRVPALLQFPLYLLLSVMVAWLFFGGVEFAFIRWSRSVGRTAIA
jgi:peptidoglycan/LPS O-acetylase OafA/YrhL